MNMTLRVIHAENICLISYLDLSKVARHFCPGQRKSFSIGLSAMELIHNEHIAHLLAIMPEEEITPDLLWIELSSQHFVQFALELQSKRTFEVVWPKIVASGLVEQRFVRKAEDPRAGEHLVADATGQILWYATYQEAKEAVQSYETISRQVRFRPDRVNEAIRKVYGLPPAPPPSPHKREEESRSRSRKNPTPSLPPHTEEAPASMEREGSRSGEQQQSSLQSIAPATQNCTGVAQNCTGVAQNCTGVAQNCQGETQLCRNETPHAEEVATQSCAGGVQHCTPPAQRGEQHCTGGVQKDATQEQEPRDCATQNCEPPLRNFASLNKKNKDNESEDDSLLLLQSISIPASNTFSSLDLSQPWSLTAVSQAFEALLPLPATYKTPEAQATATQRTEAAIQELSELSWLCQRGLMHLARLLAYFADPSSPCTWRQHVAGAPPRAWHLTRPGVAWHMSREMEQADWWPAELRPGSASLLVPKEEEEEPEGRIDLAALAGIAPEERRGMDRALALEWRDYLRAWLEPHGWRIDLRGLGSRLLSRGYGLEIWYADGQSLVIYSGEHWDLIEEINEQALLGTPEFAELLAATLQATSEAA